MTGAIQSFNNLAMMENQLGYGYNPNVPSYINGYTMQSPMLNNYAMMQQMQAYNASQQAQQQAQQSNVDYNQAQQQISNTQGINPSATTFQASEALKTLKDFGAQNITPMETFGGAVAGIGIMGSVMNNPRLIAHPINSFNAFFRNPTVKNMFKGVKVEGSALNKLWKENHRVMEDAYLNMQKLEARNCSKLGLFRKRYSKAEYDKLKNIMEKAIKSGDIKQIETANATLKHAYINNGKIPTFFQKVKKFFGFKSKTATVAERIGETGKIAEKAAELTASHSSKGFKSIFKKGLKGGVLMGILEVVMGLPKIFTAFGKDSETGMKQLGQTSVKAGLNTVGWIAGEAAGMWAWGALGAKIGTCFGPGVGTLIGGAVGMIGGAIGTWIAQKAGKALVGTDVADKIEAEKLTQSTEGQAQLIQMVQDKVAKNEQIDPNVVQAARIVAANNPYFLQQSA